jgi:hypothetical protein
MHIDVPPAACEPEVVVLRPPTPAAAVVKAAKPAVGRPVYIRLQARRLQPSFTASQISFIRVDRECSGPYCARRK